MRMSGSTMIKHLGGQPHAPRSWYFINPTQAATFFSQPPSWASPFSTQGSSSGNTKLRALPQAQKSAALETTVIVPVASRSVGATMSAPSAMGLIAPSRASLRHIHIHTYIRLFHVPKGLFSEIYDTIKYNKINSMRIKI